MPQPTGYKISFYLGYSTSPDEREPLEEAMAQFEGRVFKNQDAARRALRKAGFSTKGRGRGEWGFPDERISRMKFACLSPVYDETEDNN